MKNLETMTDEELALCYVNGNNVAFDILLQRTKDGVFSYILFVVHDEDLANDIFQDTFVKAIMWLQNGKYVPSGKFSSWLIRIAHNMIMDAFRRKKNRQVVDADDEEIISDDLINISREAEFVNEQVLKDVRHLMDYLPAQQREVVFMRYYQNLSFKEIAEVTGASINTALGRMRYALLNMRKMAKENNISLAL